MVDKKNMSVEEILAACRRMDTGRNSGGAPAESPASPPPAVAPAAAPPHPAAKPSPAPAAASSGARPSVEEMLARARGEKSGAAVPSAQGAVPAAQVVAAAPAKVTIKEQPKGKEREAPLDTASVLAAARTEKKPGPVTKAEAPAAPVKPKAPPPPMPVKPEYAKPKAAKAQTPDDRRGFFATAMGSMLGIGFTSLAATSTLWSLGLARFMFPNILTEPPSRFKIGFPSDFPSGQVQTKFVSQYGIWVVNGEYNGLRQIYALKTVCTHLGCTPNWLEGEQKFKCPCHGSGFYKDGINFEGPAPRPLERYAIRISDDGQLEIDKSKPAFHEELGQWTDPACFVAV